MVNVRWITYHFLASHLVTLRQRHLGVAFKFSIILKSKTHQNMFLTTEAVDAPSLGVFMVGWSSWQPDLVDGNPIHGRDVGTRWSLRILPTQGILWFYELSLRVKPLVQFSTVTTWSAHHKGTSRYRWIVPWPAKIWIYPTFFLHPTCDKMHAVGVFPYPSLHQRTQNHRIIDSLTHRIIGS